MVEVPGFEAVFRREYAAVLRTVTTITGDHATAEEVTQDAFAAALVRWRKVGRYDRPGAWIRRVAIRDAVRAASRQRARPVREAAASAGEPALSTASGGLDPEVDAALRRLPAQQRAAIALYHLDDRPTSEVAELLGCRESTVRVHLHRARRTLAAILREEPDVVG